MLPENGKPCAFQFSDSRFETCSGVLGTIDRRNG
jgi:hypothetical protein